jgi:hypothetical protein
MAICFALMLTHSGCVSPHTYGTPRTLPAGKVSQTLALESVSAVATLPSRSSPTRANATPGLFAPPFYMVRFGAGERAEIGLRTAKLATWGFDVKVRLLKARTVDVAVNPMVQIVFDELTGPHLHLPLLVGFNVTRDVTFLLTPGISYAEYLRADDRANVELGGRPTIDTYGALARLGAGLTLRVLRRFAIQPEVTLLRSLQPSHDAPFSSITFVAFGLGFTWGAQPSYADEACPPDT